MSIQEELRSADISRTTPTGAFILGCMTYSTNYYKCVLSMLHFIGHVMLEWALKKNVGLLIFQELHQLGLSFFGAWLKVLITTVFHQCHTSLVMSCLNEHWKKNFGVLLFHKLHQRGLSYFDLWLIVMFTTDIHLCCHTELVTSCVTDPPASNRARCLPGQLQYNAVTASVVGLLLQPHSI